MIVIYKVLSIVRILRKTGFMEGSMNLDLLDPKLIILVAMVILVLAALTWLYLRKRRRTTAGLRQKFGPEYDRALLTHGQEEKLNQNWRIARSGLKSSKSAISIRRNTNVFRNGGSLCSLGLSIPQRGSRRS